MSISLNFEFTNSTNYTFDSNLIEFVDGKARLKLIDNPSQTFTEDFIDDTGFTYDSDKAEFSGGKIQQKDQRCPDATFCANYNTNINANWGDGVLTGTPTGGADVSGGKLDLAHNDLRYVDYDADLNADSQQVGCIRFKLTPNYTGSPSSNKSLFAIGVFPGSINSIILYHVNSGLLWLYIYDKDNLSIVDINLGAWNQVINQEYEFELNYDITTGATRLFIDGVQFGATQTGTGIRDSNISNLRIGQNNGGTLTSNFKIDDFVYFSVVQHTANYTPGYTVPNNIYVESVVTLPLFTYTGLGDLQAFTNLIIVESGLPRYIVNDKYWDGANWVASDGTYAQANTYADAKTNIDSLTASDNIIIKIVFPDLNTQSDVDNSILEYTGQVYSTANPTIKPSTYVQIDGLDGFIEIISGVGNVKYILEKDNIKYYHNGASWVVSDGTYTQSNTITEIETNKATFTTSSIKIMFYIFLNSDGNQETYIDNLIIQYDFAAPIENVIEKCIVYGYTNDILGNDYDGTFKVRLNQNLTKYKSNITIIRDKKTIDVVDGYWEIELVENINMADGSYYIFTINKRIFNKVVPNENSKNFLDLVDYSE